MSQIINNQLEKFDEAFPNSPEFREFLQQSLKEAIRELVERIRLRRDYIYAERRNPSDIPEKLSDLPEYNRAVEYQDKLIAEVLESLES